MQDYVVLGELHCNIYKETFMLFFSLSEVKVTLLNSDVTPNSPFYSCVLHCQAFEQKW